MSDGIVLKCVAEAHYKFTRMKGSHLYITSKGTMVNERTFFSVFISHQRKSLLLPMLLSGYENSHFIYMYMLTCNKKQLLLLYSIH